MRKLRFWSCRANKVSATSWHVWKKIDEDACFFLNSNTWAVSQKHFMNTSKKMDQLPPSKSNVEINLPLVSLRSWAHWVFYLVKSKWNSFCYRSLLIVYCMTMFKDKQPSTPKDNAELTIRLIFIMDAQIHVFFPLNVDSCFLKLYTK